MFKKVLEKQINIRDGVFYLKWIRYLARNLRKVFTEVWKNKKTNENVKEFLFQIKANKLYKLLK